MNHIQARVLATGLIWTALTVLGVAAMVTGASSGSMTAILFVLIVGATISTGTIWRSAEGNPTAIEEAEKMKRRTRLERMIDTLDEREIEELRQRLTGEQDDERVPLDQLVRTGYRE